MSLKQMGESLGSIIQKAKLHITENKSDLPFDFVVEQAVTGAVIETLKLIADEEANLLSKYITNELE